MSADRVTFYDEHPFDWASVDDTTTIQSVVSPALIDLIDSLDSNALILDIGCGPGRVLQFLVKRGLRCVGIDRSRVSVEIARSRCGSPAVVADNISLPISDAVADIVISDGVIHHTEDPYAAFVENLRILRPGGLMYLAVYKPFGRYPLLYKFPGAIIRNALQHGWSRPWVIAFAQLPYFLIHFIRSGGKRTWTGSRNLFYDYFVTPTVVFLAREAVEEWCVKQQTHVVRYDENRRRNVHSFLLEKEPRSTSQWDPVKRATGKTLLEREGEYHMSENGVAGATQSTSPFTQEKRPSRKMPVKSDATRGRAPQNHWLFRTSLLVVNGLLVLSVFFAMYATGWEYSTRRYLTGFSDAIVPATASGEEKIEAILNWMAHGPARRASNPSAVTSDRDPTDTLNYDALLRVCGTATNAFLNLLDTGNIGVRRLLLLDSRQLTQHVVAEVLVDGRWIIVDPAFRVILHTPDGKALTSKELSDPVILIKATRGIPHYDPSYSFEHTAHIRMARIPLLGVPIQRILDRVLPGWDALPVMTLLVERESFAAMVSAVLLVIFLILVRIVIRYYGEKRLGIRSKRIRDQIRRIYSLLLDTSREYPSRLGGI